MNDIIWDTWSSEGYKASESCLVSVAECVRVRVVGKNKLVSSNLSCSIVHIPLDIDFLTLLIFLLVYVGIAVPL